jgi:hypothetical protein
MKVTQKTNQFVAMVEITYPCGHGTGPAESLSDIQFDWKGLKRHGSTNAMSNSTAKG